jgi:hypothetical protein
MANLKYFDSDTNTWKTLVVGAQGPQGIQGIQGETGTGPVNAIINGAFEINQRGFTSSTAGGFGFDRWNTAISGGTVTASAQTFTTGSGPAAGIEPRNFYRVITSGQSTAGHFALLIQNIEDVRTLAGQTVTLSFYAKAGSGTPKIAGEIYQYFGTGGSPSAVVETPIGSSTISTSWARYSLTFVVPSLSGKTIGTNNDSALAVNLWVSSGATFATRSSSIGIQNNTFDIWGVQVEAGSTATPFRRNANSIQGELAACQRYYYRITSLNSFGVMVTGGATGSTTGRVYANMPPQMRTVSAIDNSALSTIRYADGANAAAITSLALTDSSSAIIPLDFVTTGGMTSGRVTWLQGNNTSSAFIGFSAEL